MDINFYLPGEIQVLVDMMIGPVQSFKSPRQRRSFKKCKAYPSTKVSNGLGARRNTRRMPKLSEM